MKAKKSGFWKVLAMATTAGLIAAACAPTDDEDPVAEGQQEETPAETNDAEEAETNDAEEPEGDAGEDFKIGWLTDASSVTRGTYLPEYEGANLYFQMLNEEEGGVHGRPVDILVEDMQIDAELAVSLATRLIEDEEVIMLGGGTIEGRLPAVFEVVRANEIPFLTGHSARPDMFPPDPDPLLFTAGNVFEAMSDARVELWPLMFQDLLPDGGEAACYIHESPAAFAVCNRWLEFMDDASDWSPGPIVSAPLETADFSSFVQPVVNQDPEAFFAISIAAHATGVAVAARQAGYDGPIVFSMTATPEPDIQTVIDQVGGDNIFAISNITSIDEDVPEIERILEAAERYGTDLPPSSATINGWLMGMIIHDALERCGADCDREGLRNALEATDIDTRGLTGGPFSFSESDHVGPRYWTGYQYNSETQQLERMIDDWVTFDPENDLLAPIDE